jgi:prophage antirepressor-like protein
MEVIYMTNSMQIIDKREVCGKFFKMYGTIENPLFLAKDVAEWIEYDKSQLAKMLKNVDDKEKVRNNVTTLGGVQNTWFLTEYGLYEVLFQSRKPIAKQFKEQVKAILKELRLNGKVELEKRIEHTEQYNKYLLSHIGEVEKMYVETRNENKELQEENMKLYCDNHELQEKVNTRLISTVESRHISSSAMMRVKSYMEINNKHPMTRDRYVKELKQYIFKKFGVTTYGDIMIWQYPKVLEAIKKYKFKETLF